MTKLRAESVDGIPVVCESCGRILTRDSVEDAQETVDNHNKSRHNSEDVAFIITDEKDIDTSNAPVGKREDFIREIISLVD